MSQSPIQDALDQATGDVYVPSTAEVREAYITAPDFMPYSGPQVKGAEFDAWLATIKEQAVAEANGGGPASATRE